MEPWKQREQGQPREESIYKQIRRLVQASPDVPLDTSGFPPVYLKGSESSWAFGAMDALFGPSKPDEATITRVGSLLAKIGRGQVQNWRDVEAVMRDVPPAVKEIMSALPPRILTRPVLDLFWDMARGSASFGCVKWGMALGSLEPTPGHLADLLLFARHPELTAYALRTLCRVAREQPDLRGALVGLLPVSEQWAVIRLIEHLVDIPDLISDPAVQRNVLVYGMQNNDGIPFEVAFTIARSVDLPSLFEQAATDSEVYAASVDLMETLVLEPEPLGGLAHLAGWHLLCESFVDMLARRPTDIRMLYALDVLRGFFDDNDEDPEAFDRNEARDRTNLKLSERLSPSLVRECLRHEDTRWMALEVAKAHDLRELLPDVVALLEGELDGSAIDLVGRWGESEQLGALLRAVSTHVDLPRRQQHPLSATNLDEPDFENSWAYARAVRHLGRLATPEAVETILVALRDPHPWVRIGACEAVDKMDRQAWTPALDEAWRERLSDPCKQVREAAQIVSP